MSSAGPSPRVTRKKNLFRRRPGHKNGSGVVGEGQPLLLAFIRLDIEKMPGLFRFYVHEYE
jgi:hypothetical protein